MPSRKGRVRSDAKRERTEAMLTARSTKRAQVRDATALEYAAVEQHRTSATEVSSEPRKLSALYNRPNTCGCGGCQAEAQREDPTTITNAVLNRSVLRKVGDLASELTAHGVEIRKDGKLLRLTDLRALADEHLVGQGAYLLTVSKESVAKPTKKKAKKVRHSHSCAMHS